ncbi:MAG: tRNA (N6-isopentenyl adenosine(37)-C2)-methylthiotransferase MiaB [Deltaproteobacteria bacterium]|nr:tRNA (N6-isopentenyl adenosine(37)-C2)-methylthiotransferase MiaB [Deltaproteobacteria bacterium]
MSKKVFIETHGCQMNVDDSLRLLRSLAPLGYSSTTHAADADLILINTCSVREKASHKAYSAVGRYYSYKKKKPGTLLGIAGCQAQADGKDLLQRFHYLDFVLGPDQVGSLPELVQKLESKKKQVNQTARIQPADFRFVSLVPEAQETKASAYVTIMKGCDNFCSFCIVPFVRGREVSRSSTEIIEEVKRLVDQGVQEVTLLGQNVNSYGTKQQNKESRELTFAELLYQISRQTALKRLRFTTSHPKDIQQDLTFAFRDIPILAKHLHLPVQSGSNAILQKMYRTYTREEYLEIVYQLKSVCPEVALSTDIIVGFPGESEEYFGETMKLLEEVRFDFSYSFHYSPRPHTTARRYFEDDVPLKVKEERLKRLQKRQLEISQEIHESCVAKEFDVLVEGPSKLGGSLQGRNSQNRLIHFESADSCMGEFVRVKITQASQSALIGEKVS